MIFQLMAESTLCDFTVTFDHQISAKGFPPDITFHHISLISLMVWPLYHMSYILTPSCVKDARHNNDSSFSPVPCDNFTYSLFLSLSASKTCGSFSTALARVANEAEKLIFGREGDFSEKEIGYKCCFT